MKVDRIIKLAQDYSDAVQEFNALMQELGGKAVAPPKPEPRTPALAPPSSIHPGYQRIRQTPGQNLQDIAQQILMKTRGQPYGTSVPFSHEGKNYLAVLEEHEGGRVPGKHPGISLFLKQEGKEPIDTSSRNSGIIARLDERLQPLAQRFLAAVSQQGIPLVLTQGFRSMEEQRRIYEQGRTAPGHIVTHAPPGKSMHNYGLAFDVAPLNEKGKPYWPEDEDLWTRIGEIGESVGLRWGGRWPGAQRDRPHFELRAPTKAV